MRKRIKALLLLAVIMLFMNIPVYGAAKDPTHIDKLTFYDQCNKDVWGIFISKNVTLIDEDSFRNLHQLTTIQVDKENPNYATYSNCLYNKDKTLLMCYPQNLRSAMIPPTVTAYTADALYGVKPKVKKQIIELIDKNKGIQ